MHDLIPLKEYDVMLLKYERYLAAHDTGQCQMVQRSKSRELSIATAPNGTWVQTDRKGHELWASLSSRHPRASAVLHTLVARMGRNNAVVISHATLAQLCGTSRSTVIRSLDVLTKERWVQQVQIGPSGTVCAYIVSSRVAWSGKRDGIRFALFDAAVVASSSEQGSPLLVEDVEAHLHPLNSLPALFPGEKQLPTGDGLDPPSEPSLPGMEPDLPATQK